MSEILWGTYIPVDARQNRRLYWPQPQVEEVRISGWTAGHGWVRSDGPTVQL